MLLEMLSKDLYSPNPGIRSDSILRIAFTLEFCQFSLARRNRRLADYAFIGLSDQDLLNLDLQESEIDFLIAELIGAFVKWRNASAIWAIGKAPIKLAASSILKRFEGNEQLFDEEALWQSGCVVEVGVGVGAIPAEFSEILRQFCRKIMEAGTPRTQELCLRLGFLSERKK